MQTVAERPVVDAARVYAYRLLEMARGGLDPADFERVAQLVRSARHDKIDAMRAELGLTGSASRRGAELPNTPAPKLVDSEDDRDAIRTTWSD